MASLSRWVIFLAAFFCIYGSLHLYILIKVRRALYLDRWSYILLVVVLLFLMTAPINARMLTQGYPIFSLALTWIGYLWMAYLFLFVCLAIPLDLYHLIVSGLQQFFNVDWTNIMMLRRNNLALVAICAGGVMIYGAYAAYHVRIEQVALTSDKIPDTVDRVRLVQISDLHLGPMLYPGRLHPILAAIRQAQPDILVSTGDLIDGPFRGEQEIAAALRALPAKIGKFAVSGNHEHYFGIERSMDFTRAAGFKPLRGERADVGNGIVLVGVDDTLDGHPNSGKENELLSRLSPEQFSVLLKHRPVFDGNRIGSFDLQLSGHAHNGQIFPFTLVVRFFYPMSDGLFHIAEKHYLYASRGTGTWGPPIRVLAPPEITVIDLLPVKSGKPVAKPRKTDQ